MNHNESIYRQTQERDANTMDIDESRISSNELEGISVNPTTGEITEIKSNSLEEATTGLDPELEGIGNNPTTQQPPEDTKNSYIEQAAIATETAESLKEQAKNETDLEKQAELLEQASKAEKVATENEKLAKKYAEDAEKETNSNASPDGTTQIDDEKYRNDFKSQAEESYTEALDYYRSATSQGHKTEGADDLLNSADSILAAIENIELSKGNSDSPSNDELSESIYSLAGEIANQLQEVSNGYTTQLSLFDPNNLDWNQGNVTDDLTSKLKATNQRLDRILRILKTHKLRSESKDTEKQDTEKQATKDSSKHKFKDELQSGIETPKVTQQPHYDIGTTITIPTGTKRYADSEETKQYSDAKNDSNLTIFKFAAVDPKTNHYVPETTKGYMSYSQIQEKYPGYRIMAAVGHDNGYYGGLDVEKPSDKDVLFWVDTNDTSDIAKTSQSSNEEFVH